MKQAILWLAIGLVTMAMTSCESKQEILNQMEQEVTAMRQNVDIYTFDQWEAAHERLNDLHDELMDGDELTSEEQQRLDQIDTEAEKYLRAAQNVQLMRDLWEELKSIAMTCTKEEAADYMIRWIEACKEAEKCEFSPKQKEEVLDLCRKIGELGNAPIRTDF
jgi:hypothetical protein